MFFWGANSIEGFHGFFEKNFVADSNEIAVSYRIGWVEFRHRESSGHRFHLLVWAPKIVKNMSFFRFW
jgi:hypothetical protein